MENVWATELVRQLVNAAYDSGYYSGTRRDGSELHTKAISQREELRRMVIKALVTQSVPAEVT